jgi:hypothetical protein
MKAWTQLRCTTCRCCLPRLTVIDLSRLVCVHVLVANFCRSALEVHVDHGVVEELVRVEAAEVGGRDLHCADAAARGVQRAAALRGDTLHAKVVLTTSALHAMDSR